jgi:hypothetical protein
MRAEQINLGLVQGDNVVPLARALHRETCDSLIAIWIRICFCSAVKKWGTHRRCCAVKRSDCVRYRFRCWCTVDLGRQILRESSRTDENGDGNGNSAKAVSIASLTGLRSTSGASGEWLPFGRKTERCEHIWSPSSMPQRPSQECVQDRRGWHREREPSLSSGDRGRLASGPSGD